jgi:hypothetical protein
MAEFYGDLLIGGATLKHVRGELQAAEVLPGSREHLLSGRLCLDPAHNAHLQAGRRYRLHLEDGRAGSIVVSRIDAGHDNQLVVEFEPHAAAASLHGKN